MNCLRTVLRLSAGGCKRLYSDSIYEPPYLEALKPKIPLYDPLNIQIRGYDYAVLENFQAFVHSLAKNMDIEVEEAWALPSQKMQVKAFKPNSEIVNSTYNLNVYQRVVQVLDVNAIQLPLLMRAIEASTPVGVSVQIFKHEKHHEEDRYIPDQDLLQLKQELDDLGGPSKKK